MTCSSMVVNRLIAITICLSTCAQLGHSLLEELERDVTSNTVSLVQLSSTQLSDEEGSTIKFKASSSWPSSRNSYNSSKAVKGGRSYWCSKKTDETPYWWISFEAKPIEVVSIAFEEKYSGPWGGAEFEFFASSGEECAEDGRVLIKGTQAEISNEKFENGRRYHCYGLRITKRFPTSYGPLATLRNFQLIVNRKDDCNEQSCGNGNCIDHYYFENCECHAGFTGSDCKEIDHCEGQNCSGNGKCINGLNEYSCDCYAGFEGADCENRTGCPLPSSRHYKEYVDKSGYLCYKGFVVGCERINQTARACKSTYSKKMDTDTYFWMPKSFKSKEKYHICSSHGQCLKHMMNLDLKEPGDFLPCPPNYQGPHKNWYWVKRCRYGHYYNCRKVSGMEDKTYNGKCAVTAKITDRKTSHDVQLQSGYEPTCRDDHWKSHYDGDCDLRKWSPGTFKYPAIEDDPLRWG